MARTLLALAWLLLLVLPLDGCGSSSEDERAGQSIEAVSPRGDEKKEEASDYAPAPTAMAAEPAAKADEAPGGGDGAEAKGGKAETWKRSTVLANTSRLMVGDEQSLSLEGMHLRAKVDGFRARVLIDFYFYNPDDRQYEGTFDLRLPSGASPWFLAFGQSSWEAEAIPKPKIDAAEQVRDQGFEPEAIMRAREASWIEPKEARMVPKEKAAFAYGQTVRRRVDPALMEWAGAGVFNARIFPIAPRKLHRVVVGYDVDLVAVGDDLELRIPVPEGLPSSTVDLNVATPKGVALTVEPAAEGNATGPRRFLRLSDVSGQEVTLRLSKAKGIALTGSDPGTGPLLAARLEPALPRAPKTGEARPAVLLIDTSLSSNPDRFNVWLALAKALLEENRGSIERFGVLFFDVKSHWLREELLPNTPENVEALLEHASTLALEGATDLGMALREASHPAWLAEGEGPPQYDLFLLGDGAATWGEADAHAISNALADGRAGSLFAYTTGMDGGDDSMLQHLARQTGGAVFSVVGESEVKAAATAHGTRPWEIRGVALDGASDLMLAGRPRVLFEGQRLLLVGRGSVSEGARVVLSLAQGSTTKEVQVELGAVLESDLTARAYGQLAVQQLEDFLEATETEATAYARHFRVTGKSTSLLMLETEEDYLRFGIEPAADAKTVEEQPASTLVARALEQLAGRLGDAKLAFTAQLGKLAAMPGVELKLDPGLAKLLDALPRSAYEVPSEPLRAKGYTREGIPKVVLDQLAARKPEYDTLTTEAERRLRELGPADALEALSSLVEAQPGDGVLARDVGFTAMEWGLHAQAYHLFARVARARPFEPQTYRAMALTLAASGHPDLALAYFEIGLAGQWDPRFGEFPQILMQDYLRFLRSTGAAGLDPALRDYAEHRAGVLASRMDVTEADILVTITWNTDSTDVDLHVIEPSGEECYFGHTTTRSGGRLTRDVTQGYGPEMYVLPEAPAGDYQVRAKYFASDVNRASARTKVYSTITRNFGRPDEEVESKVVTLETGKDMHDLMTVTVR
ncbi:MAG: hypothetical protein H6712_31400 [Myxococcales bacterium]|nr:hypothetical protein [Myxococcales bacterium]MCB9718397.1 hypothetical protein [Myxococcales bacterium]